RLARRRQEFRRALEGGAVRQHRKAGRAAFLIGAGQRRRVEIGADQPPGGAGLLDLGDQREATVAVLRFKSSAKAPRRGRVRRARLDLGQRERGLGGGDLLALVGFDAAQDVAHGRLSRLETWTSRSSTARAEPLSMACAAISTPWPS